MIARTFTVAFEGIEAQRVEVQCALAPGLPSCDANIATIKKNRDQHVPCGLAESRIAL